MSSATALTEKMVKNERKFSSNVPTMGENPKCRKFPGKAGNEKTKIAHF